MNEKNETKQVTPYDKIVTTTMNRIAEMQNGGQIHFPGDYSPQNALQSAWLMLQDTKDMNDKPVLEACTNASIANALLDMVIQGFDPKKHQCAFIAYGKKLTCQREYSGSMLLAKRADPRIDDDGIQAEVIYEGEEKDFQFEIRNGKKFITQHKRPFEAQLKGVVIGAYCTIISRDGEVLNTVIMTIDEIHQAWKMSKTKPFDGQGKLKPDSTHAKFPVEMAKKTVINRACKPIINSSSDKTLLASVNRQEFTEAEETAALQIEENANQGELVDAEFRETEETGPVELPNGPDAGMNPDF